MNQDNGIDRVAMLGTQLHALALQQVQDYRSKHDQWIQDLYQYNGLYLDERTKDTLEEAQTKEPKAGRPFINITRPKTNAAEARLSDILLPTDDRNWGIGPTIVPELEKEIENEDEIGRTEEGASIQAKDLAGAIMSEATDAAEAMQDEIEDQLSECQYNSVSRDVIHDAAVFGTGVMKGPVVMSKSKKRWVETDGVQQLIEEESTRPTAERVDIWNFFPDSSAKSLEDAEFIFQRHLLNKSALRGLAKQPSFDAKAISKVIAMGAGETDTYHLDQMRAASEINELGRNRFEIWEYHGILDKQDLIACGCELGEDEDDESELTELSGVIWFCSGQVIRASINPLDSEDHPYSVFVWDRDDTSIFGYGIPRMIRSSQRVINSSWRMVMDNGGLSTGPQFVVNSGIIEPADGKWEITPRKLWRVIDQTRSVGEAFAAFTITNNTNELMAVLSAARQLVDEESSVPQIAQGESGTLNETARGREILINSANTLLRRIVKNWDDNITGTFIRRMYDWNMQFSDKDEIKGDFNVVARGTSALMIKDRQAQNLLQLSQITASNPLYAEQTDFTKLLEELVKSMQIEPDSVLKSDERVAEEQEARAQQQEQGQDPDAALKMQVEQGRLQIEQGKLELDAQRLEVDREKIQADMRIAAQSRDIEILKYSGEKDIALSNTRAELAKAEIQEGTKYAEMEIKQKYGEGI